MVGGNSVRYCAVGPSASMLLICPKHEFERTEEKPLGRTTENSLVIIPVSTNGWASFIFKIILNVQRAIRNGDSATRLHGSWWLMGQC